jgi:PAS domain S-box-containing protein
MYPQLIPQSLLTRAQASRLAERDEVFLATHKDLWTGVMTDPNDENNKAQPEEIENLLAAPDLAGALESEPFRRFLDQIPVAIAVADLNGGERIVYANPAFENLTGRQAAEIEGKPWSVLGGASTGSEPARSLSDAITEAGDGGGTFRIERPGSDAAVADAYANVIEDDDGNPVFRLVALVDVSAHRAAAHEQYAHQLREKELLLREIQHRVKNNLQMITALIRYEVRYSGGEIPAEPFDRLAGRIEALYLLYQSLSAEKAGNEIDLGVYLSQIASAVMLAHGHEGVRLDLKVDSYPVSVNVAMPAGLVVNELLTNALKHAFADRNGGTITVRCLVDEEGCRVIVGDDGKGLPPGLEWPQPGKLSALIVRSLRENAKAGFAVDSAPGRGMRITITFQRATLTASKGTQTSLGPEEGR